MYQTMTPDGPRIAIVGSGFGGLGMAISLERAGYRNFEVFERAAGLGGVWRENTYPGAGCDVPSPFYSFSFEPNPEWPWRYSKQESILAYLERCADKYGVRDRIRLNTEVHHAGFDEERNVWTLTIGDGEQREFDVLVCACGQLSDPVTPDFPGRDSFAGHSFHSAEWDHDYDLAGKRVAVIGTGASAIQFVPEIAPKVARLDLYQRSAPFIIPKPDREYTGRHHRLFERFPAFLSAERLGTYLFCEYGQYAIAERPGWLKPWKRLTSMYLRTVVKDPVKRAALTPDDEPGCKRLLFSNNYLQAIDSPQVTLIKEGVSAITPNGVVSSSGVERQVDTIIYATGFQAHGFVAPMQITGVGGRRLAEDAWGQGASAYLGITVPEFPNLFMLYGPNTNLGGGSIVHILESEHRYVLGAVQMLAAHPGAAVAVRDSRLQEYDREIQKRLQGSAWATGCQSWYIDEHGRNSSNWPGTMREYRTRTARFDSESYELLTARAADPAPVV